MSSHMQAAKKSKITIIGCGIAGIFCAIIFAKKGHQINLYEKLKKDDICDVASKRSYNLVLFGYAIEILKKTELWADISPFLLPLAGSITHLPKGTKPITTIADHQKLPYFTIMRSKLVEILLKKASEYPSISIHFETSILSIDRHNKTILIKNLKTNAISSVANEVIIGADGANSVVRSFIQQGQYSNHIQEYAPWVYKQFILSPEAVEKLNLTKKFVHVWPNKKTFIITHPDDRNALYALLVYPKETQEQITFATKAEIQKSFEENFPKLLPYIDDISHQILSNPEGHFSMIHTDPWYYKNFMTLVGDAAHGFYPFFGQGTSAAFGDCMELLKLSENENDWEIIFSRYQENRKANMDALGEFSKEALMRYFRYKKADYEAIYDKLELVAWKTLPKIIYPPISHTIISDPGNAATHRQMYLRQRSVANKIGAPLLVNLLKAMLYVNER